MGDIEHLRTTDFQYLMKNEVFIYINQYGYVCSTRTGEVLAANQEQLQILIAHLNKIKTKVKKTPYWLSDK